LLLRVTVGVTVFLATVREPVPAARPPVEGEALTENVCAVTAGVVAKVVMVKVELAEVLLSTE